ncbi:hypothetical protein OR1_02466 [Geobacter sp. OR-1]|uniref:hypothetical protein n=1 Tax=Geobacter sp. OR-1 TaxID=1266765 RepID=UPI0005435809|nr:hypothetical protein [Geobacter sp. OR-1]GAM10178.1 hypothetical protein OR1_02466 [Geobacter sp. OR-1]
MDKNETTTTVANGEAPLERDVTGRYGQLSPIRRFADLIARGESRYNLASERGGLASEIFGRWGRQGDGGREQLPFVAGFSRSESGPDDAPVAAESAAEIGNAAPVRNAGQLPQLRARQESGSTGGKESPLSAATVAGSPASRSSGTIKRADRAARPGQLLSAIPAAAIVSRPVAAVPASGEAESVVSGVPESRVVAVIPAEHAGNRPLSASPAMAGTAAGVDPGVAGSNDPATRAERPGRLIPAVTRLSEGRDAVELPVAGSPLSAPSNLSSRPSRPVLLRKLPPAGGAPTDSGSGNPIAKSGETRTVGSVEPGSGSRMPEWGACAGISPMAGATAIRSVEDRNPELSTIPGHASEAAPVVPLRRPHARSAEQPVLSLLPQAMLAGTYPGNGRADISAVRSAAVDTAVAPLAHPVARRATVAASGATANRVMSYFPEPQAPAANPFFAGGEPHSSGQLAEQQQFVATAGTIAAADPTPSPRPTGLSREELAQVADQVYTIIEERLTIEKERRGL